MITYVIPTLAIGNSQDAKAASKEQFDAVLNVAIDLDIADTFKWRHKVGLLDGPGNDPMTFVAAVLMLHSLIKQGKRVLVHCHEGKSRSVMVAATLVAVSVPSDFDQVLSAIMKQRNVDTRREALYELAQMTIPIIKRCIYPI